MKCKNLIILDSQIVYEWFMMSLNNSSFYSIKYIKVLFFYNIFFYTKKEQDFNLLHDESIWWNGESKISCAMSECFIEWISCK